MEAEEPQQSVSASIPATEDIGVLPAAIMRSSQIPALEPEAQEGQDPSYKWTDGHRPLMTQPKESRDISDYAPESMPFFSKDIIQEGLVVEACATSGHPEVSAQSLADIPARTTVPPELWTCTMQGGWLDTDPMSCGLGSRVDVELQPELTSLALGISQAYEEEESSPDSSAHRGFWPPSGKHLAETNQSESPGSGSLRQRKQLQFKEEQESQGQDSLLQPLEAQRWKKQEEQEVEFLGEGTRRHVYSGGLQGEQEEMVERANGQEEEQQRKQAQVQDDEVFGGQGEKDGLGGDLESLNEGEWSQVDRERRAQDERDSRGWEQGNVELRVPEESGADSQCAESPSFVGRSEQVKQEDHSQTEKVAAAKAQEEGAASTEVESEDGERDGQGSVGEERSSEERHTHRGPSPVSGVAPEVLSPCALFPGAPCPVMTQIPGFRRGPDPEALTSTQPLAQSGSFCTEVLLDGRLAPSIPQDDSKLRGGTVTPPKTPDPSPFSPAGVFPATAASSPARPPVAFSGRETQAASPSNDTPPPRDVSEASPPVPHGVLPADAATDPCGSSDRTLCPMHLASCTGVTQHLRSNSFPGSHRTEQTSDLVGMSLSLSHSELPHGPSTTAICASAIPRRDRRNGRDFSVISESPPAFSTQRQDSKELVLNPERSHSPHGSHPWGSPKNSPLAVGSPENGSSPPSVSMDARLHEPLPPPPPEKRHVHLPTVERDGHRHVAALTLKRHSHPPPLALSSGLHGPLKAPFSQAEDTLWARQHRPLPSTPGSPHRSQTSVPRSRLRYNKPLPPTPDLPLLHHSSVSSSVSRMYRPLPPIPIIDPSSEPPPLPPKTRVRNRSAQGGLLNSGDQTKPRPIGRDWIASTTPSAGRTSWPPATTGRSTESLVPTSRGKSEVSSGLAFSNMTNCLDPSSPTTPWTPELQTLTSNEPGLTEETEAPMKGPSRRPAPQKRATGTRRSAVDPARQPDNASHPQLEKASSWPHRRDPGITPEGSSGQMVPGEGTSKHKGWNRQGLRRPSILPESSSDLKNSAVGRTSGPSDSVVFREKKPKEGMGGFSRRCSKLINSSQLLYQEYSDVVLNKEIQSQQRLDSLPEAPGLASPRQPRRTLVSSDSYLQRLSMASSGSLWQEIPVVRNSTVLLSMTHEDQKLQEAKFELIVSEASYLRSLNVAVDHFQHSAQLRATLSNQDHQWLFSRLQDVRDVSATFLSDLEENFENNIFSFQVCDVVLSHAPDFRRVYLPYVTNQTYQERTFQSLMNSNSGFGEVLEKLESDPACQRLSLKSFLILPFQRITRLKLLLQNILKRTQPGSAEEAEATKAHHALEQLIRDCNNNVQRMRRTEELIYLSQKIEFECKIFPLISQSRWLVKSGELTALEFSVSPGLRRKLNTRPVHLHLFNDCLLLSRPKEGSRFLVFDHAPFSSIRGEKCEMKLHGPHKNVFRLFLRHNAQGAQAEFLFRTETQSEKLRWISALAMPREELDLLECYDSPQVQCLRAYKPRENDELALEKADVVMVTQQSSDGWLEGVRLSDGEQGWFPVQQVEFISNPDVRVRNLKEAHRVKTARLQLVDQQA
uniref:rho guanine nucleotide exchange factor 5 n=1 Tax=Jaculus jaculus TaxID=51337 RepID=UPI001E1B3D03|nr:rho guanine nucleotide exchange factor 5 [Jaculus jaculus]XP_045016337.1 rho guanine nucleotide exchange factor 5 [Jaculus jaculus]XP_045016338.1 rho guanine nucleotide exchange factor 5 [Jaculus jaculus]